MEGGALRRTHAWQGILTQGTRVFQGLHTAFLTRTCHLRNISRLLRDQTGPPNSRKCRTSAALGLGKIGVILRRRNLQSWGNLYTAFLATSNFIMHTRRRVYSGEGRSCFAELGRQLRYPVGYLPQQRSTCYEHDDGQTWPQNYCRFWSNPTLWWGLLHELLRSPIWTKNFLCLLTEDAKQKRISWTLHYTSQFPQEQAKTLYIQFGHLIRRRRRI
jgi:hypothetical protein